MHALALTLLAALLAAPGRPSNESVIGDATLDRLPGFSAVVLSHVTANLGLEVLPTADGAALEPGMFVTIGLDRIQVFDRNIGKLVDGRSAETTSAVECGQQCPASLFDAFQAEWLGLAIESTQRGVEMPSRVVIAAHNRLPAFTLLDAVYAMASSRPIRPPDLQLVLGSTGRGLRGQSFFVLPPQGLELGQGSSALGLQLAFGRGRWLLRAEDPQYVREVRASDTKQLAAALREVKRRYPSKQAIILVPDDTVTVGDLVSTMTAVRAEFPRIVLSAGQDVILP
ncbi:MAG: hypothetical protein IAG13_10330 [Deltaproteobacteria bacterium]|nr:hypothetical protein [Nannocystaceae bacterium]